MNHGGFHQQQRHQQLPVKAAIEGPAACFRLLEIDEDRGMSHADFVGLLYSATDNRVTLEDIHEAWLRHADHTRVPLLGEYEGIATDSTSTRRMLLPSFLRAFTDLASAKYRCDDQLSDEERSRGSFNRLLLRDVYGTITNRTSATTRYGMCAPLLHEDVSSFLLSQRALTTYLFTAYGRAPTGGAEFKKEGWIPPLPREGSREHTPVSKNGRIEWAGFLAIASDLQLIPRIIGLGALQAAVEQVSMAPHRARKEIDLDSPLSRFSSKMNARDKRSRSGMPYPQFLEVLALLALSAAGRLRALYPEVAGPAPSTTDKQTFRSSESPTDSSADTAVGRSERSLIEGELVGVGRGTGRVERAKTGRAVAQLVHGPKVAQSATPGLKGERSPSASRGASAPSAVITDAQLASPPYDLGVLKALYYHAQVVLREQTETEGRGRSQSGDNLPRPSVDPRRRNSWGLGDASKQDPLEVVASEQSSCWSKAEVEFSSTCDEGVDEKEGAAMVGGWASGLHIGVFSPLESAQLLTEVASRVSDLEAEVLPRETSNCESWATHCAGAEKRRAVEPAAPGAGGAFARLVVIKELQPVPEHAPDDARNLIELTLDHHQAGRYALALGTLQEGMDLWAKSKGVDPGGEATADSACDLQASDEALALLIEGSIRQSAGSDDDALSTLLKADAAISSVPGDECIFRDAVRANVLSEIGVTLYYSSQTALGLRCFRLALVLRCKHLHSRGDHVLDTETEEPGSNGDPGWKHAPDFATQNSDKVAVEAGATAAAIALNNFAVCLAGAGITRPAARALMISSTITTSALGIEHQRSAVVARNLAIVKATRARPGSSVRDRGDGSGGQQEISRWEKELWHALLSDCREGTTSYVKNQEHANPAGRTSHVISGGFCFAGKLPTPAVDGVKRGGSIERQKKKKGMKKRGKSVRRR